MSMKAQLTEDMKTAMKSGEKEKLAVIRLINSEIKQREVDERIEITDVIVLAVLAKMIIDEALAEAGVSGPQAMGKVMPVIKAKIAGRADMGVVSQLLKAKLAG